MYGIFTYICLMFVDNVGKYKIHGSYGRGIPHHCTTLFGDRCSRATNLQIARALPGENWLACSYYVNMVQSHESRKKGRHVMMAFKDVKAKFGQKQGETIYHEKKAKQDNKGKDDDTMYFMKHPDCKDQDARIQCLNW